MGVFPGDGKASPLDLLRAKNEDEELKCKSMKIPVHPDSIKRESQFSLLNTSGLAGP